MKILDWIRNLFRPKRASAASDELRPVEDKPDVVPSESDTAQTRD